MPEMPEYLTRLRNETREMRESLSDRGCKSETQTYLADGVYCGYDGYHVWLMADRDGQRHSVALEPDVLAALYRYVRQHIKEPTE